uniref:Uncharacterized protein n=1 Tax=Anguilla anguilla TaxID=7936 RepID=A0A0E9RMN2_ANGAN
MALLYRGLMGTTSSDPALVSYFWTRVGLESASLCRSSFLYYPRFCTVST